MSISGLPRWRRSVAARFACIALAMLPALAMHGWMLDGRLPLRLGVLLVVGLLAASAMSVRGLAHALHRASGQRHSGISQQAHAGSGRTDGGAMENLLDALAQAALLAALWPPTIALWPAACALVLALAAQRLLGGWAINPFPSAALALAIAVALARSVSGADFTAPLISLLDAAFVAATWLAAGLALVLLRLWPARAPLAFAVPVALACGSGGVPATGFVVAAIVAAFVLADTRHLPATRSGQVLVGAFAGLGTAALWLGGAPPVAIAGPVLLACALAPWIEHLTLPRARPAT